jgi:hypothetical protein
VIRVPGKTEPELYNMIERWFLSTYKNPDKAIKAKIPNESIRAQGFESDAVKIAGLVYSSLEYSLTVEIKQGKARFTLTNMNLVNDDGTNYYFENYVYKKDGSERTNSQASNIKESTDRISNNLFSSLRTALLNPDAKKDDW